MKSKKISWIEMKQQDKGWIISYEYFKELGTMRRCFTTAKSLMTFLNKIIK